MTIRTDTHMLEPTQEQSQQAFNEWGANCGPHALAFALGLPLIRVKQYLPDFEPKRYMNPTMMGEALCLAGVNFTRSLFTKASLGVALEKMFHHRITIVRIQWEGPWLNAGVPKVAAYCHTHWVAAWNPDPDGISCHVYDVNCGAVHASHWEQTALADLMQEQRATGWYPTHFYRLDINSPRKAD